MGLLSNGVEKGVLRMEGNKNHKPGEDPIYHKFYLEADDPLHFVYELPKQAWYMFTDTELERYVLKPVAVTTCSGIQLGNMYLFQLGSPCVVTRLLCGDDNKVVRLPLSVVKRTLQRGLKNAEDAAKPGLLDRLRM